METNVERIRKLIKNDKIQENYLKEKESTQNKKDLIALIISTYNKILEGTNKSYLTMQITDSCIQQFWNGLRKGKYLIFSAGFAKNVDIRHLICYSGVLPNEICKIKKIHNPYFYECPMIEYTYKIYVKYE